jgi:GNAT superfamily N-acetyltransferase
MSPGRAAAIRVERTVGPTKRAVLKGLGAFNDAAIGKRPWRHLAVSARRGDRIMGGVVGTAWGGWLFVSFLWIDEALRGRDVGRRLMRAIEDEARAFGCTRAYVDTFSFQAPGFYEKLGYGLFGKLDDYPVGHARYWFTKAL